MTIGDVVELLNAEPGKYDGYDLSWYGKNLLSARFVWCSRHCWVMVWSDQHGRVMGSEVGMSEPETWLAKLWDRFAPPQMVEEPLSIDW